MNPLVVVGASLAGVRTVESLRRRGFDGPIVLAGSEPHLPYDRPPLSKGFLRADGDAAPVALCTPDELAALDVELRLGAPARELDHPAKQLTVGGERIPYSTLVIATGSVPRNLPPTTPGAQHDGVHTFRTLDDALVVRRAFEAGARVAVVGGGFIGAEVADAARCRGLDVTVIDPLTTLMTRGVGHEVGRVMACRHADRGVRLQLGRKVARIDGADRVERVVLDDGTVVAADLVVVGIGVEPAVSWLAGSGLDTSRGVVCDATLRAAEDVFAVGDVAGWTSPTGLCRGEHWTNAADQARALAATLTGTATAYDPVPYVWSDQLGGTVTVWGEVGAATEHAYLHGDAESDEFVVAAGGAGRLLGVVALGARREAMRAVKLLRRHARWVPGVGPVGSDDAS